MYFSPELSFFEDDCPGGLLRCCVKARERVRNSRSGRRGLSSLLGQPQRDPQHARSPDSSGSGTGDGGGKKEGLPCAVVVCLWVKLNSEIKVVCLFN